MSTDQQASTDFCPHCSVEIPTESVTCPHCHIRLKPSAAEGKPRRDSLYKYLDNPWYMLGMLFFVTAGVGLPLLWMSHAFGTVGKTVLTILMIPYTGVILWLIFTLTAGIFGQVYEVYRTW